MPLRFYVELQMTSSDFRFSPRANRANEIHWMNWDEAAFARAAAEDKPILLSISAVWCHWCHVMDETTYSDPGVISTINERFVPIRVDNDRRPDINARYNMGGWPTTAFLTPEGRTLTGATYLPPPQMRRALTEIARFFVERKHEISVLPDVTHNAQGALSEPLDDAPIVRLREDLEGSYDTEFGGFGSEPKFPQTEALEFLFSEWRATGDEHLYDMVAGTMRGMSQGGTYDHIEGGFFRYSTTRDWSVPHFEKMAEDHAGLLRILAMLVFYRPDDAFRATLRTATDYVRTVLYDPQRRIFAGSQDADEAYFELPLEERRKRETPFVDRTSYTNWTCGLAGALCWVAQTLDDAALLDEAQATLDTVYERLDSDGVLFHVLGQDDRVSVAGLLTDHAAYLRALLDAYELGGEARFLERAIAVAATLRNRFQSPDGGFYDRLEESNALGRLALRDRPITDNGIVAEALLRLHALTGDSTYRETAQRTLAVYAQRAGSAGSFGAAYARALLRYLSPEVVVRIAGHPAQTAELRAAALRLPSPFVAVRTLTDAEASSEGIRETPVALVCRGTVCAAPVRSASDLDAAYDALAASVL
jgi:uncharacterized protein YyaL (SSP411 family)